MGQGKPWRALVLGGGGATGEFQVGALPVLTRTIDSFDFYAGVGVGALHATILAQYPDSFATGVDVIVDLWKRFTRQSDLLDIPVGGPAIGSLGALFSDKAVARDSVYGNATLKRLIDEYLSWDRLAGHHNWGIEVTSLSDGLVYAITNDPALSAAWNTPPRSLDLRYDDTEVARGAYLGHLLGDFIAAAGAVPLMLPPVDILGHRFVEGGLRDFIPLELASLAFRLAHSTNPISTAEFTVLDNYTREIQYEPGELLDSGTEIVLRAIKIMTVEMAQNDILRAEAVLNELGAPFSIRVLRPRLDFRLHPLDFDDRRRRRLLRDEGATVAAMEFPNERGEDSMLARLAEAPEDTEVADQLVRAARTHAAPQLAPDSRSSPASAVAPRNLDELYATMRRARDEGRRLKAVGTRYAFSSVTESDGTLIDLSRHLNAIVPVDGSMLKNPATADEFIEFEAGATIAGLNDHLWGRHRALVNQPGFDELTFFGVATTGGHGSGMGHGPLSEAIRALNLAGFDKDGDLVVRRLEPSDGITNPAAWSHRFPGISLIQDDELFDAATVSFGSVGVVTSLVVAIQDSFFLEERRWLTTWADCRDRINELLADSSVHSVHAWLNPYQMDREQAVVLSEYRASQGPRRGHRGWGVTFSGVDELADLSLRLMKVAPRAIPTLLTSSLRATVPIGGGSPVLPCWEALSFGAPNQVRVDPTNIGVPVAQFTEAVDALIAFFEDSRGESPPAYITCPVGLRFTPSARAYMSPQRGRATCMIELPFLKGTLRARDSIQAIQKLLYADFDGRPHWGQIHDVVDSYWMPRIFGDDWVRFRHAHAVLDPMAMFASKTTEQIGLTLPAN